MGRKIIAVLAAVLMMLTVTATSASAATKPHHRLGGTQVHQGISGTIGDHIYVKFNRKESHDIVVQGSTAETLYVTGLACALLGLRTAIIAAPVLCAQVGVMVAALVHDVTNAWMNAHPHQCITATIKYIPFTSNSNAYFEPRC